MAIRLATRQDVPDVMALESRNYIGNLDESQRAGGYISILHSRAWFDSAVDGDGLHIAVGDDGTLEGFIAMTDPPPLADPHVPPIIRAMLELAGTTEFNGEPIAQQRYAFRGPVLIDAPARGQGLYSAFNTVTLDAYRGRYDVGVLFVAADNPRSLHTVTTKLGASPLAEFDVAGAQYHFLAFAF